MDVQFWIYLIIGVIFFLTRMLKKSGEPGGQPPAPDSERPQRRSQAPAGPAPRPMTFEELLREITEGKKAQEAPREQARPYATVKRDVEDEGRSLEEIPDEQQETRIFDAYEEAKRQASQATSLEETLKLKDTPMEFGKFKAFQAKDNERSVNSYINIIRNPETLKQAVVMSEVLKRKF